MSTGVQARGPFGDGWTWGRERNATQRTTRRTHGVGNYTDLARHKGWGRWLILVHLGAPPLGLNGGCRRASPASVIPPAWTEHFSARKEEGRPRPALLKGALGDSTQQQAWGTCGSPAAPRDEGVCMEAHGCPLGSSALNPQTDDGALRMLSQNEVLQDPALCLTTPGPPWA